MPRRLTDWTRLNALFLVRFFSKILKTYTILYISIFRIFVHYVMFFCKLLFLCHRLVQSALLCIYLCWTLEQLSHNDSYVYLAAIGAVEALAVLRPAVTFAALLPHVDVACERPVEERLKMGEAMTRILASSGRFVARH